MIRKSSKYGVLGGVCAGYAISEKKPVALVRLFAFLIFTFSGGTAAILYLFAWLLMQDSDGSEVLSSDESFVRTSDNKVIGGVCGAVARYFKIDATVVRALTALSVFVGGVGLFLYIFAWIIIPERTLLLEKN